MLVAIVLVSASVTPFLSTLHVPNLPSIHIGRIHIGRSQQAAVVPSSQWAVDLASALGNSRPTSDMVAFLAAWHQAEGGSAANNWLNTTLSWDGATDYNSVGVKNFQTYEDGIAATVQTLQADYPGYADIREGIVTNDPERALRGLYASPWGTNAALVDQLFHAGDTRVRLVQYALSLQGLPYVYGGRSTAGADCSGSMQLVYKTVAGRDIGATTYSQLPNLQPIELADIQPGDLWYG
jgi:cell wall-associated NlpC family hydrolase